jgi:phytoene synthase
VYALYGFARYADEIVDAAGPVPTERAATLRTWSDSFLAGLEGEPVDDDLLPAVLHTIDAFDLDRSDFALFLRSMEMDLTVTRYATYGDLLDYMEGSAAVIGTMMLPVLGSAEPADAAEPARELGRAFQLTNFIRDVAEDFGRGRIYLPQADLVAHGVGEDELADSIERRIASARVRQLIAFEVDRARAHYRAAEPGIALLDPSSRPCIRAAYRLYQRILDEIEAADHDVCARRAVVPRHRQLALAAGCLISAGAVRMRSVALRPA